MCARCCLARCAIWLIAVMWTVATIAVLPGCDESSQPDQPLIVKAQFGEAGSFPGQFSYPRAIDTDGRSLWVVDKLARVQQLDPQRGEPIRWFRMPQYKLGKPTGITIAPATYPDGSIHEAIYIADTHYHRVLVYAHPTFDPVLTQANESPTGASERSTVEDGYTPTLLASFGSFGDGPGEFIYPTDIAVTMTDDGRSIDRIFVSEYGGHDRISVFDSQYTFLYSFGILGEGDDPARIEFSRPQSMAITPDNTALIVTDSCHHRLGRFALDGTLLNWIGSPDQTTFDTTDATPHTPSATHSTVRLNYPYGLEMLDDGTVLVTEFGASELQHIDPIGGRSLGRFGSAGRGDGQLATPWASVVIGHTTFVLDSGNNRVVATHLPGVERTRNTADRLKKSPHTFAGPVNHPLTAGEGNRP